MIKLSFITATNEVMRFTVNKTEIWYQDRIFSKGIRCIPKDENFTRMILESRNKYPNKLIEMFTLSKEEQKEYDETAPKGEEALAEVIIKDCKKNGLRLLKQENIKNGS